MSNRYATIITDDDGREVVSAIGLFEGTAPQARIGRIEPVVPGVLIGMVRGGPVDAIGGFGFPRATQGVDESAIGLVRASLKAAPAERGEAPAKAGNATGRKTTRKPAKAKRRKAGKIKRARPAKQILAEPAGVPDHG
jgi:hypothetical protein